MHGRAGTLVSFTLTSMLTACAAALVLTGCAAQSQEGSGTVAANASTPSPQRLSPALSVSLPQEVHTLAYDPARHSIWYAAMSISGGALYEVDSTTGKPEAHFTLPGITDTGLYAVVRVAPDASIWVADGYSLVRVDPSTGRTAPIALPLAVAGELPTAVSGGYSPGTWITSMTLTSNSMLVARNNVPFLQQWSLSGSPLADVPLPPGFSAPVSMTTTASGLRLAARNNPATASDPVQLVTIAFPEGSGMPVTTAGDTLASADLTVPWADGVEVEAVDGTVVAGLDQPAPALTWHTAAGSTETIPWPKTPVVVHGPPGPGHTDGGWVKTFTQAELLAALPTPGDELWIVSGGGSTARLEMFKAR